MEVTKFLLLMLTIAFVFGLFPLIYNAILTTDTSTWTFLGHEFASQFLQIIPFLWIAFGVAIPIYVAYSEGW